MFSEVIKSYLLYRSKKFKYTTQQEVFIRVLSHQSLLLTRILPFLMWPKNEGRTIPFLDYNRFISLFLFSSIKNHNLYMLSLIARV